MLCQRLKNNMQQAEIRKDYIQEKYVIIAPKEKKSAP
jgi:hypothetical protein